MRTGSECFLSYAAHNYEQYFPGRFTFPHSRTTCAGHEPSAMLITVEMPAPNEFYSRVCHGVDDGTRSRKRKPQVPLLLLGFSLSSRAGARAWGWSQPKRCWTELKQKWNLSIGIGNGEEWNFLSLVQKAIEKSLDDLRKGCYRAQVGRRQVKLSTSADGALKKIEWFCVLA